MPPPPPNPSPLPSFPTPHSPELFILSQWGERIFFLKTPASSSPARRTSTPIDTAAATEAATAAAAAAPLKRCNVCGSHPEKPCRCSRCQQVYYCSRACQSKDWTEHKKECTTLLQLAATDHRQRRRRPRPPVVRSHVKVQSLRSLAEPPQILIDLLPPAGRANVVVAGPTPPRRSAQTQRSHFIENWRAFTDGSLDDMDWTGVLCAGGAVLACSIPLPGEETIDPLLSSYSFGTEEARRRKANPFQTNSSFDVGESKQDTVSEEAKSFLGGNESFRTRFARCVSQDDPQPAAPSDRITTDDRRAWLSADPAWTATGDGRPRGPMAKGGDIDLFLYGLSGPDAAEAKLRAIHKAIAARSGSPVLVVRSAHAVTFVQGFPRRHIQVILRIYSSPAEILLGFDLDASCLGFDGDRLWCAPRGLRALNMRTNTVDTTRRSLSYERRLEKYAQRGFSVTVPQLRKHLVDPALFDLPPIDKSGFHAEKGLRRLLLVDLKRNPTTCCKRPTVSGLPWYYCQLSRILGECSVVQAKWQQGVDAHISLREIDGHRVQYSQDFDEYRRIRDDHRADLASRGFVDPAVNYVQDTVWGAGNLSCDYDNVFLPFAEGISSSLRSICQMLDKMKANKECAAEHFMEFDEEMDEQSIPTVASEVIRTAPIVKYGFSLDSILDKRRSPSGKERNRKMWMTSNCGRQGPGASTLLTGSFNPIEAAGWSDGVHLEKGQHEYYRIILSGGVATMTDADIIEQGEKLTGPHPFVPGPIKKSRTDARRKMMRALLLAFPQLSSVFRYFDHFLHTSEPVREYLCWKKGYFREHELNVFLRPGLVLRTAARGHEVELLNKHMKKVCKGGNEVTFKTERYIVDIDAILAKKVAKKYKQRDTLPAHIPLLPEQSAPDLPESAKTAAKPKPLSRFTRMRSESRRIFTFSAAAPVSSLSSPTTTTPATAVESPTDVIAAAASQASDNLLGASDANSLTEGKPSITTSTARHLDFSADIHTTTDEDDEQKEGKDDTNADDKVGKEGKYCYYDDHDTTPDGRSLFAQAVSTNGGNAAAPRGRGGYSNSGCHII